MKLLLTYRKMLEAVLGKAIMKWLSSLLVKTGGNTAKLLPWTSRGQTLICLEHCLENSLGVSPEGQLLKKKILKAQEQTVPLFLRVSQQVKGLTLLPKPREKEDHLLYLKEVSGNSGCTTVLWGYAEGKLERQKPSKKYNLSPLLKIIKKAFTRILRARGDPYIYVCTEHMCVYIHTHTHRLFQR